MIWTGILLLICHVIATFGSDNYLSWTKDVQQRANTVYDSNRNKVPVYAWSRLGRKLPTYTYRQQDRQLPQAWQLQDRLALTPRYNLNRENKVIPVRNAWNQGYRQQHDSSVYQQLLDNNNPLQTIHRQGNQGSLNRLTRARNLNRAVDWNRLAKLGSLSHRYYLDQLSRQGKLNQVVRQGLNQGLIWNQLVNRGNQVGLQQQQRERYVNPNSLYNRLNQQSLYLNQNRQTQYNPSKYWQDYKLNNRQDLQSRQGYTNARKQHEWNIPPYRGNQQSQAYKSAYSLKLQDRLSYKNPSYSLNRQNQYQVPSYSASVLNRQLNGAWKSGVPYSLVQRLGDRDSNSVDQQNLDNDNLLNVNGLNRQDWDSNGDNWGKIGGAWGR